MDNPAPQQVKQPRHERPIRAKAAPAPSAKVHVPRSLTLRPDEWVEIVARGRRREV